MSKIEKVEWIKVLENDYEVTLFEHLDDPYVAVFEPTDPIAYGRVVAIRLDVLEKEITIYKPPLSDLTESMAKYRFTRGVELSKRLLENASKWHELGLAYEFNPLDELESWVSEDYAHWTVHFRKKETKNAFGNDEWHEF